MDIRIQYDISGVDWGEVPAILERVGMAHYAPDVHRKAFANSAVTVFAFNHDRLAGFARAISDGAYQAAVYDMAIIPEYQGRGLGKTIMEAVLDRLPACHIILYASPGKEGFYEKLGFRRMKTGMARFVNAEQMRNRGFTE